MSTASRLNGRVIWLTRPQGQADALRAALEDQGAVVFHLPLLEIVPREIDQATKDRILDLDRYDLLFFISTNAVRWGMERICDYWPQYPAHIRNFCVGPGTARALEEFGLSARYPAEGMNSEALLALPELRELDGKRALIVRGEGGRELLAGELHARGARVDYLEVYRREAPRHDGDFLRDCLDRFPPDAVVITSAEALENFAGLFEGIWPGAREVSMLVPSERMEEAAKAKGFLDVRRMEGADDASVLRALV